MKIIPMSEIKEELYELRKIVKDKKTEEQCKKLRYYTDSYVIIKKMIGKDVDEICISSFKNLRYIYFRNMISGCPEIMFDVYVNEEAVIEDASEESLEILYEKYVMEKLEPQFTTKTYCDTFISVFPVITGRQGELREILNQIPEYSDFYDFPLSEAGDIIFSDEPYVLVDCSYTDENGNQKTEYRWFEAPYDLYNKCKKEG